MKTPFRLVVASLSAALLAACGDGGVSPQSASTSVSQSIRKTPVASVKPGGPTLYVLNTGLGKAAGISIYSKGGASLLRSISLGQYSDGFTVDLSGHLYAGFPASQGDPSGPELLNIYSNRGVKLVRTLNQTHPFGLLTLDKDGNLYTLCAANRLCEYASAMQQVIRKIALTKLHAVAGELAVDRAGNLAVNSGNAVLVFAPGKTQPYWTITGISALRIAFDVSGNLYVASMSSVAVYAAGATSPFRTISEGIMQPVALTLDSAGDLYVLNYGMVKQGLCTQPPTVTVYAPNGSGPTRSITEGLICGQAFYAALDRSGDLYVANVGSDSPSGDAGNVVVYAPGGSSPMRTVTNGVQNPSGIGIGP